MFAAALSAAALLVAGCSSSGTVGSHSGSSKGSSGGFTGGTGGDFDNSDSSSDSSSGGSSGGDLAGGSDPGCVAAMTAIQNATKLQSSTDPKSIVTGLQTAAGQLHSAAGKTHKAGAKQAMNKVADDLGDIIDRVKSGKAPDTAQALIDAEDVSTACGA
ncbi:MAG: hypothetical protein JF587_09995 [Catenulisporales bacterium]|nr:hypothetical protein [Catenulisporales bacterium]